MIQDGKRKNYRFEDRQRKIKKEKLFKVNNRAPDIYEVYEATLGHSCYILTELTQY